MKFLTGAFVCVCVLGSTFVDSGVIDQLKHGVGKATQTVRCGLHRIGSALIDHRHAEDPCVTSERTIIDKNEIGGHVDRDSEENILIDVRGKDDLTSTVAPQVSGKRLISVGSNCAPGYRADSRGICREEY